MTHLHDCRSCAGAAAGATDPWRALPSQRTWLYRQHRRFWEAAATFASQPSGRVLACAHAALHAARHAASSAAAGAEATRMSGAGASAAAAATARELVPASLNPRGVVVRLRGAAWA